MKQKVLFICTNNSARSQIAEGLLRSLHNDEYEVFSAGLQPTTVNSLAITTMKEIGIDISRQKSKNIEKFKDIDFDFVVTVCDNAKESCPFFPGRKIIHKSFEDPANSEINAFRNVRDEIKRWIESVF